MFDEKDNIYGETNNNNNSPQNDVNTTYGDFGNVPNTANTENFQNNGMNYETQTTQQNTNGENKNINSYEWGNNHQGGYYKASKAKKEKKPVTKGALAGVIIICLIFSTIFGVGGGLGTYFVLSKTNNTSSTSLNVKNSASTGGSEKSADGKVLSTEEISDKVADSVVEIVTETVSYSYFYGQAISEGAGSGVIIDENGHIVTNNHVIEGAKSIKVTLRNGNEYSAKLIGADADKDVALIKIEPKSDEKLTVATLGNSEELAVGDKAVAIGNPLGQLGGTVTDGIISALDREVTVDNKTMNLLQTDAAINPGNSGGGLFDGQGNLIGIVVAKASGDSSTGTVEGLGFAIPINDAKAILKDLKEYGYVQGKPAQIGVTLQDYMNMVYVYDVNENSPADKAGLQEGDKIMKVDGEEVTTSSQVKNKISNSKAGDKMTFEIERNGEKKNITVTIEEAKKSDTQETTVGYENVPNMDDNSIWDNFGF